MKKHWLYYITPCTLASVIVLIFCIMGLAEGGFGIIPFFFGLPALCILIALDWLVKKITKGKLLYIWIIELILVVIGVMCIPQLRLSGC
ncbi:MAG TPA: hypothetical protein VIM79_17800 [Niastella sp.]